MNLLPDFPPGPLDFYRKKASFDWKKMKICLYPENIIKLQNKLTEVVRSHPDFQDDSSPQSIDEDRCSVAKQSLAIFDNISDVVHATNDFVSKERLFMTMKFMGDFKATSTGKVVARNLYDTIVLNEGTERHSKFLRDDIFGTFCLTEIAHGSNTKAIRTTATYDKERQEFILHTPDFEAAKCWSAVVMATHAVVFAQMYIDDVNYGLHIFIVPLRDPKTLEMYTGVLVGDMGEKIGLNGLDNGFVMFNNYRIPRENLLNKNADVTPDGIHVTSLKNITQQYMTAFRALSEGRINAFSASEIFGIKAITIAIRYAAVRKQFGPLETEEVPILEYQSHQYRLLPYLACSYTIRFFWMGLYKSLHELKNLEGKALTEAYAEIHALSAGAKAVITWLFRDAIQESREACGGHGYLKVAEIGDLRDENDAYCTVEGDNNILLPQTSNWVLKLWSDVLQNKAKISTSLESADYLTHGEEILKHKFSAQCTEAVGSVECIIDAYQWLVCYLAKQTKLKLSGVEKEQGLFWARSNSQVFYARNLSAAFVQHFILQRMLKSIDKIPDVSIKTILLKLFSLYGLWSLEKFLSTLYEGGYMEGPQGSLLVHEAILKLCSEIKDDSIALVDAIAPPDFSMHSVLGASDGEVYKRLEAAFLKSPRCMSKPTWWKEIVDWKSKL